MDTRRGPAKRGKWKDIVTGEQPMSSQLAKGIELGLLRSRIRLGENGGDQCSAELEGLA